MLLDSSFLIAVMNPTDLHHDSAIAAFDRAIRFSASTLSITEVLPRAIKEGREELFWQVVNPFLREIFDVDQAIAQRAAKVRVESGLKTPDAIISASASRHRAQLWTFDGKLAKAHRGARLLA